MLNYNQIIGQSENIMESLAAICNENHNLEQETSTMKSSTRECKSSISLLSLTFAAALILTSSITSAEEQKGEKPQIDASDPTRIVTFIGLGPKYTQYVDNSNVKELQFSLTVGLGLKDMIMVEGGYGNQSATKKYGMTTTDIRHFHLFKMDQVDKGYRGWGSAFQLNLAGTLPGTDGQNLLGLGATPAFALGGGIDLYPVAMVMNSWDKGFGTYNGGGLNFSPMLSIKMDYWDGAFVNIWPQYTRFFWGNLGDLDAGGGQLRLVTGGKFTPTLLWRALAFYPFDKNLRGYDYKGGFDPRGRQAYLFRIEQYF